MRYATLKVAVVFAALATCSCGDKVRAHFEGYARQQITRASLLADACSSTDGTSSALTAMPSAESMQSAFIDLFRATDMHTLSTHASGRVKALSLRAELAKVLLVELAREEKQYITSLREPRIWQPKDPIVVDVLTSAEVSAKLGELKARAGTGIEIADDAPNQVVRMLTQLSARDQEIGRLRALAKTVSDLQMVVEGKVETFSVLDEVSGTLGALAIDLKAKVATACMPNVAGPKTTATAWVLDARSNAERCLRTVSAEVTRAVRTAEVELGRVATSMTVNAKPASAIVSNAEASIPKKQGPATERAEATKPDAGILSFIVEGKASALETSAKGRRKLVDVVSAARADLEELSESLLQFRATAPEMLAALEPITVTKPELVSLVASVRDSTQIIHELLELDASSSLRVLIARFGSYQLNAHVDVLLRWIVRGISSLEKRLDTLSDGNMLIGMLRAAADVAGLDRAVGRWLAKAIVKTTDRFKISRAMLVSRTCVLQEQLGPNAPSLMSMFLEEIVLAVDPEGDDDPLLVAAVAHGMARAQLDVATRESGVVLPAPTEHALTTELAARMMGHVTDAPGNFGRHAELTAKLVIDLSVDLQMPELQRFASVQSELLRGLIVDHDALVERSRTDAEQTHRAIRDLTAAVGKVNDKVERTSLQLRDLDRVNRACLVSKTLAKQGSSSFTCTAQLDVDAGEKPQLLVHYNLSGFQACGFVLSKLQVEALDQFAEVLEQALRDSDLKVSIRGYASEASPEKCMNSALHEEEMEEWKRWCDAVRVKFGQTCLKARTGTKAAKLLNESLAAERARRTRDYLVATPRLKAFKLADLSARLNIVASEVAGGKSPNNLSVAVIIQ